MQEVNDLLYEEMEKLKNNFLSQPIGLYLINSCSEEDCEELCSAVLSENKKFEHCLNYILNYAKKNAVKMGNMSCSGFEDEVIYAKAVEYYLSDNIADEDIKSFEDNVKAGGTAGEKIKVAKSKISSDEQASVFGLMEGDNDDNKEEPKETDNE